jgi:hypothetical protein
MTTKCYQIDQIKKGDSWGRGSYGRYGEGEKGIQALGNQNEIYYLESLSIGEKILLKCFVRK